MKSAVTIISHFFHNVSYKAVIFTASFLYLIFASNSAFAATVTYTANGNFTVPAGVNQVTVSMSGAGGGGGALSNSGAGADGGDTLFGALLTAFGGLGGSNGSADIGGGVGGAMGGVGGQNGSNGTVTGYGGRGGNSLFGTGGAKNATMFVRASRGSGYGSGGGGGFDGGGGGGAQAISSSTVAVASGQIIPITIGIGGAGSTGNGAMAYGGSGASGFVMISYVLDTTIPVITLLGTNPVTINVGTVYVDAGVTALDNIDGNITANVVTTNTVNTAVVGTYIMSYSVSDSSGNFAIPVVRTVNVVDTVVPVITLTGANPQNILFGAPYVELGAVVTDNYDMVIVANIDASSVNTSVSGSYSVTYNATDSSGNVATQVVRTVVVGVAPDTTAPVVSILGLNPVSIVVGGSYVDAGATALDNIDGDISASIVATSTVNTVVIGSYTMSYSVSDSAGNVGTATRVVNVVATPDITAPVVTLVGASTTSAVIGTPYIELGATALDNIDGDITANIVISGAVDIATIGSYSLLYSVSDSSGNSATTTRTVDIVALPVVDTTAPSAPIIASVNTIATTTLNSTLVALWSDATDDVAVSGYSFVWDINAVTTPDNVVDGVATTTTTVLPNGTWYFHIVAVDTALNVSTPVSTFGPIVINNLPAGDTTAPVGPTAVSSSTHVVSVTSTSTAISLSWDTATDETALAGYSYVWDFNASTTPDTVSDISTTSLSTNLPNGTWYFHIASVDTAGNISSPVVDFGPIIISTISTDTVAPVGPTSVTSVSHVVSITSTNQNINVAWDSATDETSLAGYSYIWDNITSTTPDVVAETANTTATTLLPNGTWYFHVASVDTAGNISSPVVDFGPIVINTNLPADITLPSSPVATVATSSATTIDASWTAATDDSGALAGYSFVLDTNATTTPDAIAETQSTSTSATLADGLWYFHLVAVDPSLNISSPTTHAGPFRIDTLAPVISLVGATVDTIVIGNLYVDVGATALDNIDGDITASIVVTNPVDTNTLGTYIVSYAVTDMSGNLAIPVVRTVQVIAVPDITLPVITITGATSTSVMQGNSYVDLGATATDNVDGNVTANIVTTNLVNTAIVGAYTVDYTVQDSSGNIANASRAVTVFAPVYFDIVASSVGNGVVAPIATSTILQGGNQSYAFTPNFGYDISALVVDGVSVATSTSYTFSNVQVGHTLEVTFAQNLSAPFFNILATAGINGTVTPMGTTTIQQGNSQVYSITPDAGYSIASLMVDGIATTTTPVTFSNINADHTISVTFVDLVAPVGPTVVTSSSHTSSAISANQNVNVAWDTAIDNVSVAGYSYAWDMNPVASPDANVDIVTASTTSALLYGTWYLHIVAVDASGNVSTPTIHFGPVIISDSQVLITNSTIGGTVYDLYSPTVASSTVLGITGTSTLSNVALVTSWNLSNVTIASSTLTQVTASDSVITNSTLTNATSTNSTLTGSTLTNATVDSATLTGVTVLGTSSTITNSTLANTTVTDAVIINDVMTSGTIVLPNGTPVVIVAPTPLTSLVNFAPVASFTTSANNLAVTLADTTTDPNSPALADSWVYNWNFGDGFTTSATVATLGNNQPHTYTTAGTYTVSLTVTDLSGAGLSSTSSSNVTVTVPVPVSNGGGGGGGGGSWYSPIVAMVSDFTGDGIINLNDFGILLMQWGMKGLSLISDINKDQVVDILDFNQMLVNWSNK